MAGLFYLFFFFSTRSSRGGVKAFNHHSYPWGIVLQGLLLLRLSLTTRYEARISLPFDLDINQEQIDAISNAHTKTV
jgi:hypothetical protein